MTKLANSEIHTLINKFIKDKKKSDDYSKISDEEINITITYAIQNFLDFRFRRLGYSYFVMFDNYKLIISQSKLNTTTGKYIDKEFNIKSIKRNYLIKLIKEINNKLDKLVDVKRIELYKNLIGDIVYGKVSRITTDDKGYLKFAVVEFMDSDSNMITAFCPLRELPISERNSDIKHRDAFVFYVKRLNSENKLILSRVTNMLPKLLINEYLQYRGYDLSEYNFLCVRRIIDRRLLIISIGVLPNGVIDYLKEQINETIRIFTIPKNSIMAKQFFAGKLGYLDIARKYINLSTTKNLKKKSTSKTTTINTSTNFSNNAFLNRLFKGED